jgi:hypothetical protein
MKKYLTIIFVILFCSCKTKNLSNFHPIYFTSESLTNDTHLKDLFEIENRWVRNRIDSLFLKNGTVFFDTSGNNSSAITSFQLKYILNSIKSKNIDKIQYNVIALPVHKEIYNSSKYLIFGFNTDLEEAKNFNKNTTDFKKGFNGFITKNFFEQIIPWHNYLKTNSPKDNVLSFSLDNISFEKDLLLNNQKLYLKRIVNNSFVKNVDRNNNRVKNLQKLRNEFFLSYYNNTRKLFNKKTDYSVNIKVSESLKKDSIYLDLNYYSKKNKEVNILIPDLLKTHYSFSKHHFDLGNHIDANIEINSLISIFIGNNKFIRYGDGAY